MGGVDASGAPLSSAEIYNPHTGHWTLVAPMHSPRADEFAVLLQNGRVLVTGGTGQTGSRTTSSEIYDPRTGKWTPTGSLNVGRSESEYATVLLPDGRVLLAGGYTGAPDSSGNSADVNTAEVYSPRTGTWTLVTSTMSSTRSGHAAILLRGNRGVLGSWAGSTTGWRRPRPTSTTGRTGDLPDSRTGRGSRGAAPPERPAQVAGFIPATWRCCHGCESTRCGWVTAPPPGTVAAPVARPGPLVPLWGIAVDAAILVVLIVTIARNSVYGLDFFHVFGGALWISIDLLMGFVIGPTIRRLDIPARMVFSKGLMTKMMVVMPTAVICTLAAGWQLARADGLFTTPYSPQHAWILAALIVVALLAIIAYTFLEPANIVVLMELRKPEPNGPLIGKMMQRFLYAAGVLGVLQLSMIVIMVRLATW